MNLLFSLIRWYYYCSSACFCTGNCSFWTTNRSEEIVCDVGCVFRDISSLFQCFPTFLTKSPIEKIRSTFFTLQMCTVSIIVYCSVLSRRHRLIRNFSTCYQILAIHLSVINLFVVKCCLRFTTLHAGRYTTLWNICVGKPVKIWHKSIMKYGN